MRNPNLFKLVSDFEPRGDQIQAIEQIEDAFERGSTHQTLLGVTGSGKTFTMANIIESLDRPTLVISHNKTLAAQLYGELRQFFPDNAVEYFISYYDYYQPEAYVASSDTYIEKDASINDEIEKLRLRATSALLQRKDVIVVASVSCIYGIGSPEDFRDLVVLIEKGQQVDRQTLLSRLVDIQYSRNDIDFKRGTFRVKGDVIDIYPAYADFSVRVELFGDEVERISSHELPSGRSTAEMESIIIYPANQFVTRREKIMGAIEAIKGELEERLAFFRSRDMLLEAQRLEHRTRYDIEMLIELGFCSGIENYSRHISGRKEGDRPACLIDFFPDEFLTIIDESHVTIPQVNGMYNGDRARKTNLVDYGFRLPSALDNRPLKFEEFESLMKQVLYVSATPGQFEYEKCNGVIVEQIIRPTGLLEPEIEVRPLKHQVDDLIQEIKLRAAARERILVSTLTKRMAEDLHDYLDQLNIRVRYIHSEIGALERVDILRDLRLDEFDVLVGVNLLREGLDLPEVSLVAILDADKEGFLRSGRSLMQTAGRAARNVNGKVIFYADKMTDSMQSVIDETERRRTIQTEYNREHGIIPKTITKSREQILQTTSVADYNPQKVDSVRKVAEFTPEYHPGMSKDEKQNLIKTLKEEMRAAVKNLEFEEAARIRDQLIKLGEKFQG